MYLRKHGAVSTFIVHAVVLCTLPRDSPDLDSVQLFFLRLRCRAHLEKTCNRPVVDLGLLGDNVRVHFFPCKKALNAGQTEDPWN